MSAGKLETKIVLLGDSGVGKTSIITRYVRDDFTPDGEQTNGIAFESKVVRHKNDTFKLNIWDTAGQEKYHSLAPMYYKEAHAALLVYDVTSKTSFEVLKEWVKELREYGPPNLVIAIAGNKIDLIGQVEVDYMEASIYAKSLNALFALTSAREDKGISDLFTHIIEEFYRLRMEDAVQNRSRTSRASLTKGRVSTSGQASNDQGGPCPC
eukprot:TRINITY_DN4139_c0_g1_i4.p1 TRINITY_DN4139_c0_g1~~TRINITY_DN4139_c0_g1_i4.p1  ORF type:complete len:210 (+),score=13.41 TRINITY_DN4139_c0_g1_i4:118-747(+)